MTRNPLGSKLSLPEMTVTQKTSAVLLALVLVVSAATADWIWFAGTISGLALAFGIVLILRFVRRRKRK